jgi:hypothetical protein
MCNGVSISPGQTALARLPALFTTTSIRQKAVTAASTMRAAAASSPTFSTRATSVVPETAAPMLSAIAVLAAASRSTSTIRAPSSTKSRPVAKPMLPAPEVMMATFPARHPAMSLSPLASADHRTVGRVLILTVTAASSMRNSPQRHALAPMCRQAG